MNALRTGLRAESVLLPTEDPAEYAALVASLTDGLQPVGAMEEALVARLAMLLWRSARLVAAETGLYALYRAEALADQVRLMRTMANNTDDPTVPEAMRTKIDESRDLQASEAGLMGRSFLLDQTHGDGFAKIARYESRVNGEIHRTLNALDRIRAMREGTGASVPAVVDLTDLAMDAED